MPTSNPQPGQPVPAGSTCGYEDNGYHAWMAHSFRYSVVHLCPEPVPTFGTTTHHMAVVWFATDQLDEGIAAYEVLAAANPQHQFMLWDHGHHEEPYPTTLI